MTETDGWKTRFARGVAGGLLSLGVVTLALRGRIPSLVGGVGLGILIAFSAAYLETAIRRGIVADSKLTRALALMASPPVAFLVLLLLHSQGLLGRDLVMGFVLSAFAFWCFAYGLRALWEAPVTRHTS